MRFLLVMFQRSKVPVPADIMQENRPTAKMEMPDLLLAG